MQTKMINITDSFSLGNYPAVYDYLDEAIKWRLVGAPNLEGKAAVLQQCKKLQADMEGTHSTNTHVLINDDRIAVQGYCDYTTESGKPGKVEYCDIYRIESGKIVEITSYCIEVKNGVN